LLDYRVESNAVYSLQENVVYGAQSNLGLFQLTVEKDPKGLTIHVMPVNDTAKILLSVIPDCAVDMIEEFVEAADITHCN
jgi:hypothetical protein